MASLLLLILKMIQLTDYPFGFSQRAVLERSELFWYQISAYATLNMTATCQQLTYASDPVHGSHISKSVHHIFSYKYHLTIVVQKNMFHLLNKPVEPAWRTPCRWGSVFAAQLANTVLSMLGY